MPINYTSKEPLEAKIARLRTIRDAIANHEQAVEVLQADLESEQASCAHRDNALVERGLVSADGAGRR